MKYLSEDEMRSINTGIIILFSFGIIVGASIVGSIFLVWRYT